MTHVITSLCLRDSSCFQVCPVEAIVPGKPISEYPRYYIDPETCIDCGACVAECPNDAIFPEDEVPDNYTAKGGEFLNHVGLNGHFEGTNSDGEDLVLDTVRQLETGETVDLTPDIQSNSDFFENGPGYSALDG